MMTVKKRKTRMYSVIINTPCLNQLGQTGKRQRQRTRLIVHTSFNCMLRRPLG